MNTADKTTGLDQEENGKLLTASWSAHSQTGSSDTVPATVHLPWGKIVETGSLQGWDSQQTPHTPDKVKWQESMPDA